MTHFKMTALFCRKCTSDGLTSGGSFWSNNVVALTDKNCNNRSDHTHNITSVIFKDTEFIFIHILITKN